ncbi:adenylate kinase [Porphyromonadaceae bacterium W3.11]|nr:adenylate kinase [Porphyromonadaceae bacterium W3.11]
MLNLIMFGAPGSGKGTQSKRVAEHYGLQHISTGDLLRGEAKKGTPLGMEIDRLISKGQFVPDQIILDILLDNIETQGEEDGIILDGFPRTVSQAESLLQKLEERKRTKPILITLSVDDEELTKRLLERGKESGRSDDNIETIKKRLEIYHNTTQPVLDFYKEHGLCCEVNGVGKIPEITERIIHTLDELIEENSLSF